MIFGLFSRAAGPALIGALLFGLALGVAYRAGLRAGEAEALEAERARVAAEIQEIEDRAEKAEAAAAALSADLASEKEKRRARLKIVLDGLPKAAPLPAGCVLDLDRVRLLNRLREPELAGPDLRNEPLPPAGVDRDAAPALAAPARNA